MGLTLGVLECINCRDHEFEFEDLTGRVVKSTSKRGKFCIPIECPNCEASMSVVFHDLRSHSCYAVAYYHTNNDEPCYDEECSLCSGNGKGWWRETEVSDA